MSKIYYYAKQVLFWMFLIAYVILMAKALLFKTVSPLSLFDSSRELSRTISLVPFKTISAYQNFNPFIALMNVLGNIALFVPLGLYLQIFKRNKAVAGSVIAVFAVSLLVEVLQFAFGLGSADIDDIILNTLGGFLGVLAYRIIYFLLKDEERTKSAILLLFIIACACFGAFMLYLRASGIILRIF